MDFLNGNDKEDKVITEGRDANRRLGYCEIWAN